MDPSYSPNSQGNTPVAGGFSGVGVPASGMPSGVPAMQQAPISSGTGDVVLSAGGRSKKPLIIGGVLALIVAIVCGVVAVFLLNGSNKTAEEEYADIYETTAKYSSDINDINRLLKDGYNGTLNFGSFYRTCKKNIKKYHTSLSEFGESVKRISYKKIDSNLKGIVKQFVEDQVPNYLAFTKDNIEKIDNLCDKILDNDEDGIKNALTEIGVKESAHGGIVASSLAFNAYSEYSDSCRDNGDSAECLELVSRIENYRVLNVSEYIMKAFFEKIVNAEQIEAATLFQEALNGVINNANDNREDPFYERDDNEREEDEAENNRLY